MGRIKSERVYNFTPDRIPSGNVIYWMSREQRVSDNPGLLFALSEAVERNTRITVVFTLTDNYPGAYLRHYDFMLKGLQELAYRLKELNIPFNLLVGEPHEIMTDFAIKYNSSDIIVDFDPLKVKQSWINKIIKKSDVSVREVDGHNVVPARFVSDKVEFGAYTLRPKIHKSLEYFLEDFSSPLQMPSENYFRHHAFPQYFQQGIPNDILNKLDINRSVKPFEYMIPGEKA
ncbi:MAG TPA: deoxyribodipyrimidine photo-lyase, partial [Bacteroidales bacterium]|nr:deoxyribodipyrimidine photo-lyase [Bacteroidales bacterium]